MTEKGKNRAVVGISAVFFMLFFLWGLGKPEEEISYTERRGLMTMPEISLKSISTGTFMENFEDYALDQFPLRERFRNLKAISGFYIFGQKDNNGVYIEDGCVSKLEYPFDAKSVDYASRRFQFLYDRYFAGTDVTLYLSVIPDKNCFMAESGGYLSLDYDVFADAMKEKNSYMQYIDIFDLLELSDYYRTDIHWRQDKIIDVADRLMEEMGVKAGDWQSKKGGSETGSFETDQPQISKYEIKQLDIPFYGVYYGQSALPLKPDELLFLTSPVLERCIVYDYETDSEIPVYNMELAGGKDPYEMFLSGSKALLTITNPYAASEKELILFRDSFGSSIAPLLAEGYKKIILVDIRYLACEFVGKLIEFDQQDILFLYSVPVLNNSVTLK